MQYREQEVLHCPLTKEIQMLAQTSSTADLEYLHFHCGNSFTVYLVMQIITTWWLPKKNFNFQVECGSYLFLFNTDHCFNSGTVYLECCGIDQQLTVGLSFEHLYVAVTKCRMAMFTVSNSFLFLSLILKQFEFLLGNGRPWNNYKILI